MKEKAFLAIFLLAPLAVGVILSYYMHQTLASTIMLVLYFPAFKIYENVTYSEFYVFYVDGFINKEMRPLYSIVHQTVKPYMRYKFAAEVLEEAKFFCVNLFRESRMTKEEAEMYQVLQEENTYGWRLLAYCIIFKSKMSGEDHIREISCAKKILRMFCAEELCRFNVGQCFLDLFNIDREKLQKYCNKG
jgi:hypothetical protein